MVLHIQVGNIHHSVSGVTRSNRPDNLRFGLQDVTNDAEVMGRQVPDDVDIVLKETQIHPNAVHVIAFAQFAASDDLADLLTLASSPTR